MSERFVTRTIQEDVELVAIECDRCGQSISEVYPDTKRKELYADYRRYRAMATIETVGNGLPMILCAPCTKLLHVFIAEGNAT